MRQLAAAGLLFAAPVFAHASVSISEIAWMGTPESSNGEWVELYNDGPAAVDLKGWKLYEAGGGTLVFTLAKPIDAGGFLVIERTTSSVPDPLPDVSDEAGAFGGSGLNNSGEHLVLKDSAGTVADDLDFSGGWPKGSASSKATMQKSGTNWITAAATPKAANAAADLDGEDAPAETSSTTPSSSPASSHSSDEPLSKTERQSFSLAKGRDRLASVGAHIEFSTYGIDQGGSEIFDMTVEWSMGDGAVEIGSAVRHAYKYPGTYVVIANARRGAKRAVARVTVTVVDPRVSISKIEKDFVELSNDSEHEVNLEGWKLSAGSKEFAFPRDTIILPNARLSFPREMLGLSGDSISLRNPAGTDTASVPPSVAAAPHATSSEDLNAKVAEARDRAIEIRAKLALMRPAEERLAPAKAVVAAPEEPASPTTSPPSSSQTAAPAEAVLIYREESPPGVYEKVKSWLRTALKRE